MYKIKILFKALVCVKCFLFFSAKISVCKQNSSAESPRTRFHFPFFRGTAALFD